MVIKPLSEKTQEIVGTALCVVFAPALLIVLAIVWLSVKLDQLTRPSRDFTRWFAWRPVTTDHGHGETIWLEWVERASWYGSTIYRRPGDTSVRPQGPESFQ